MAEPKWMKRAYASWSLRFPYIAFPVPFFGVGAVFAAFLNALHNYHALSASSSPALFPFIDGALAGALVFGVLFALASITFARRESNFFLQRKEVTLGLSVAFMLSGCIFLIVETVFPNAISPVVLSAIGTVFGIGGLAAAFLWGAVFAKLEPQSSLFAAAASFGLACLFNLFVELVQNPLANYIGCAALVIVSAYLLPIASASSGKGSSDTDSSSVSGCIDTSDKATEEKDTELLGAKGKAASAAKQLWMPLVGAVLATFIFGLTWDSTASGLIISNEPLTVTLRSLAGPLVTVAIIMVAVIRKPDSSVPRIIQSALFPLAIALLLALPTIKTENLYVSAFTSLLDKASFSVIIISIWAAITSASRTSQIPAHILLPFCLGLLGGSAYAGLNLIHVIGMHGQTLCLILFAIYLALISTSFAINTRTEKASIVIEATSPTASIQKRSDALAAAHGLSPRELEVLYLLGRGYNHGYIATRLYISENTVRTHVRHIYSKLGISSREDLIELIDQEDKET